MLDADCPSLTQIHDALGYGSGITSTDTRLCESYDNLRKSVSSGSLKMPHSKKRKRPSGNASSDRVSKRSSKDSWSAKNPMSNSGKQKCRVMAEGKVDDQVILAHSDDIYQR